MRECVTCKHHVQALVSIDDAPADCWNCVNALNRDTGKHSLPLWEPKDPLAAVDHRINVTPPRPSPEPESALKTQVGGGHYKNMVIQPLEFAIANRLDFFQKDILKYITRRKGGKAKRIEDLKKAQHYLSIYIESLEAGTFE